MKRVVLIGSVVIDTIKTYSGDVYRSPGGITYTLVGLAKLLPDYEILPVTHVGKEDLGFFEDLAKKFPNISLHGITVVEKSNYNVLEYLTKEERVEFFRQNTPGIKFEDVYPFLKAEAVYVNYIKNDDFALPHLRSLSSYFREGIIYVDVHSLIRKVKDDGSFVPYPYSGWQSLVQYADFIQMNLEEAKFFTGFDVEDRSLLKNLIAMILINGPRGVSITMGKDGVLAGMRENTNMQIRTYEAEKVETKDPTGCGDIYGAAVLSGVLKGLNFFEAVKHAVKIASEKARMTLEEFINFTIN